MEENGSSFIPITEAELSVHAKRAEMDIVGIEWRPKKVAPPVASQTMMIGMSLSGAEPSMEKLSLYKIAMEFSDGGTILTDATHHVLSVLKKGLEIGSHLESLYVKASGVDALEVQNNAKTLPVAMQAEFAGKQTTRASIALWSAAQYVVWELAGYRTDEVSGVSFESPTIVECPLTNAVMARRCMLFYLARGLSDDSVNTELAFVKFTLLYFRALLAELKLREAQFRFAEPFTERKYKLEKSEFIVDGFKELGDRSVVSVEFNRVDFKEIVGNKIAKHNSIRTIMRMLCYDAPVSMNPMREIGGLAPIRLGYGVPGTGKSMTIAAIATELSDRAKWIGIPFLFHPMPDAIVSTYQGGSAERMMAWMNALRDPTKLIYAPIDDAENSLENRVRQGVSAGVREVIAVFLRNTEGAYAINRGNTLVDVCTNLPEQVDPAVMSRIVERYVINGAETEKDFIDQDYAWWKKYAGMSKAFIDMQDPTNYGYFDDQKPMVSITKDGERYTEPKNADIKEIVAATYHEQDPKNQRFFGALYQKVKARFPGFSSRDVRNIQNAVTSRMLDFDFPLDWLDEPTRFFLTPYEEKKGVLVELLKSNMKGLSFREIRLEEALRYLDGMAGMANIDFDRQVSRLVESMRVEQAARRQLGAVGAK